MQMVSTYVDWNSIHIILYISYWYRLSLLSVSLFAYVMAYLSVCYCFFGFFPILSLIFLLICSLSLLQPFPLYNDISLLPPIALKSLRSWFNKRKKIYFTLIKNKFHFYFTRFICIGEFPCLFSLLVSSLKQTEMKKSPRMVLRW